MASSGSAVLLKIVCFMTLLCLVLAQFRSGYAPKPQSYPNILPQFAGNAETTVGNRFGGITPVDTESVHDEGIPKGYDPEIWKTIASWPKEHQPFWFINSRRPNSKNFKK